MKKIFFITSFILITTLPGFSQLYPINSMGISYVEKSYFLQKPMVPFTFDENTGKWIKSDLGEKYPVTSLKNIEFADITFSFIDLIRSKSSYKNRKYRFGELLYLRSSGGVGKSYNMVSLDPNDFVKDEDVEVGFGYGAFFLYHPDPDIGAGLSWKSDYHGEILLEKEKSSINNFYPNNFFTLILHYKHLGVELSSSISTLPSQDKMVKKVNKWISEDKRQTNRSMYFYSTYKNIKVKYLFGEKLVGYLFADYTWLDGLPFKGILDTTQPMLGSKWTEYPVSGFKLYQYYTYRTFKIGLGFGFGYKRD